MASPPSQGIKISPITELVDSWFLLEAGNSSFSINAGPMFVLRGEDLMRKLPIKLLIQSDAGHDRVPGPIHHFKIVAPE